ncbi:MAG: glycosyltransferase family 39 protein [Elusimicrobia bacterium]|nr:glycosyltransferase family 39 protein [Elusimicrobiota bacterium]
MRAWKERLLRMHWLWLALGAFLLRTAYALTMPNALDLSIYGDQQTFHLLAQSLAGHGVFGFDGVPGAPRAPLYPFFLTLIYGLAGTPPYLAVRMFQALLGAGTVGLIYFWALQIFGKNAAFRAALIASLYPFYIFYSAYLLQETLLVFLSVLALYLLQREFSRRRPSWGAGLAGISLGALVLTKPTALPFAGFALLFAGGIYRRWAFYPTRRFLHLLISFLLCAGPWLLRNHLLLGRPVLDTHGGITAFEGIVYYRYNKAGLGGIAIVAGDFWPQVSRMPEVEQDRFFRRRVWEFIRKNPGTYLRQVFGNFLDFWRFYPRLEKRYPHRTGLLAAAGLAFELPLLIFGLVNLFRFRWMWRELMLPVAFVCNLMLVHSLVIAQMRYRLPIMAVFILLAASRWPPKLWHRDKNST